MRPKRFKVTVTPVAQVMFAKHVRFLSRVNEGAARRLSASFNEKMVDLAKRPYSYPFADNVDVPNQPSHVYRKCLLGSLHKIIFAVEGNRVYIHAGIDVRLDNGELI